MENKFDLNIIENFRKKLLMHDYVNITYIKGNNIWNKVFSCVDWIEFSINDLKYLKKLNIDRRGMYFFHYLQSIDCLIDAIKQLWLAFENLDIDNNDIKYPYNKSRKIFQEKDMHNKDISDDIYFKKVRAVYGVHATNGNAFNYEEEKNVRMFSSFPNVDDNVVKFFTYYNNDKIESKLKRQMDVDMLKIEAFGIERYNSINSLLDKIILLYLKYYKNVGKINIDKNIDNVTKLSNLRSYAKKKYLEYSYKNELNNFAMFLNINLDHYHDSDRKMINDYINKCIDEVFPKYQKFLNEYPNSDDINLDILNLDKYPRKIKYYYDQILLNKKYYYLKKLISKNELPDYIMNVSDEEKILFINANCWYKNKNNLYDYLDDKKFDQMFSKNWKKFINGELPLDFDLADYIENKE